MEDKVLVPDEKIPWTKKELEEIKNKKISFKIEERPEVIDVNLLKEYLDINYKEELLALKNDDTYYINCEDKYIRGLYLKYGLEFTGMARTAILRMMTKNRQGDAKQLEYNWTKFNVKIAEEAHLNLQMLEPSMQDIPITFNCIIMALGPRKAYIKSADYECKKCGDEVSVKADDRRHLDPVKCNNRGCHYELMKIKPDSVVAEYVQKCILQEPLEDAKNSYPVTFTAKLLHKDVGEAFISQKKRITGIFRTDIHDKEMEKDIYIDILSMKDLDDNKLCVPTESEIKSYKEASKKGDFMDKLCKSFAPTIYGYRDIKESMLLTLVGAHEIVHDKRGWINMFMVGDPSMAKSKLLEFAFKVTPKSIYTSGKGTSAAGLTIGMVKQADGTSIMMAGVYPSAHMGYACLDEFDKMGKDDRSSMHEVMEQGKVSRALAGNIVTLPAIVGTLAAANPRYGSYDMTLTLKDNLYLPSTILTRFDIIWLLRDKVDTLMDTKKAKHVLKYFEEGSSADDIYMNVQNLSGYLNYCRQLRPKLSKAAGEKLLRMYTKLREAARKEEGLPVSMRQFESLIRLTLAHARLYMKDMADEEDVDEIIRLVRESFASMGYKIEITSTGMLFQQEHQNKSQKFIHAWQVVKDTDGLVSKKKLKDYLKEADDWSPEDVDKLFFKFERAGSIIEPKPAMFRWV